MRRLSPVLTLLFAALALAVAGCGGSDEESEDESATPAEAVAEIDEIKRMLDEGLAQYQDGDQEAADTTVGDAYLEHFEKVEHPLEEEDHELMEELEEAISTDLRNDIKDGKSADEIEAAVAAINTDLDRAVVLLKG